MRRRTPPAPGDLQFEHYARRIRTSIAAVATFPRRVAAGEQKPGLFYMKRVEDMLWGSNAAAVRGALLPMRTTRPDGGT